MARVHKGSHSFTLRSSADGMNHTAFPAEAGTLCTAHACLNRFKSAHMLPRIDFVQTAAEDAPVWGPRFVTF